LTALTATPSWRALFADDPGRAERFSAEGAGPCLDYSKNRITDETLRLLLRLAEERGVAKRRDAMFAGDKIDAAERRAVMHVALGALAFCRPLANDHILPHRRRTRAPSTPSGRFRFRNPDEIWPGVTMARSVRES
jgi:hypothetical protein